MTTSITLRATKDSALTHAEVDANFTNLKATADAAQPASFTPSGTGAVARTVESKLNEIVSVKDFGAVVGASGDLGAVLQACHDALGPDGGAIHIPACASYYGISTTAAFTKPITLYGDGMYCSELVSVTNALTWITSTSKLDIFNMHFSCLSAAAATNIVVKQLSTSANNNHGTIRGCYFDGGAKCYWSQYANGVVFENNNIASGATYGLHLENLTNSDIGDSFISNNNFSGAAGSVCIYVPSTSGLYISNNKFNSGVSGHIHFDAGANPIGDFVITGNSFEGHVDFAIKTSTTSGSVTKTLITGNQFSSGDATHVIVGNGSGAGSTTHTTITGNTFNSTSVSDGIGIDIQSEAISTTIVGNEFHQIAEAIKADATNTGITISGNRFYADVGSFFIGESGLNAYGSDKELAFGVFTSNASNANYVNACRFKGDCIADIEISGTVQGAGSAHWYSKKLISGTTVTDLIAAVSTGSTFDVQVVADTGYVVVGIKLNGATGTAVTMYVNVTLRGYMTEFKA